MPARRADRSAPATAARTPSRHASFGLLATPYVALPIWALNLGLWFLPPLFDAAERHTAIHVVFHLCLLTAGTIMWLPVFETLPAPEWFGTGAKLAYIVAVRMVGTVLANVLVWASARSTSRTRAAARITGSARSPTSSSRAGSCSSTTRVLTLVAIAWLFLRMAQEGEVRQQLIERGLDERAVRRAVRYGRWRELEG